MSSVRKMTSFRELTHTGMRVPRSLGEICVWGWVGTSERYLNIVLQGILSEPYSCTAGQISAIKPVFGLNASLDGNLTLSLGAVARLGPLPSFTPSGSLDSSVILGLTYKGQTVTGRLVFMDEGVLRLANHFIESRIRQSNLSAHCAADAALFVPYGRHLCIATGKSRSMVAPIRMGIAHLHQTHPAVPRAACTILQLQTCSTRKPRKSSLSLSTSAPSATL